MNDIQKIIIEYRKKDLIGDIVCLSPISEEHLADIVRMRNEPKMMYYLNQSTEISFESQKEWYYKYKQRTDDLYWVIKDKTGTIIGTNRLYNITPKKCEQGSLIIDTRYAMTAPFAVEAIMISLDFAFDILGVNTVINEDRHDNKNMNSLTKRFGFKLLQTVDIRGVVYNYYELQQKNYKRDDIYEVLKLWLER